MRITSVTTSDDSPASADYTHPAETLWGVRVIHTLEDGSTRSGEIRAASAQAVRAQVRALNRQAEAGQLGWKDRSVGVSWGSTNVLK